MDDVASPTVKLSDVKHHASMLSNFLLDNSLHFGVNEIISSQKLVENIDKMTIANLDREHQKIFEILFQKFWRIFTFV